MGHFASTQIANSDDFGAGWDVYCPVEMKTEAQGGPPGPPALPVPPEASGMWHGSMTRFSGIMAIKCCFTKICALRALQLGEKWREPSGRPYCKSGELRSESSSPIEKDVSTVASGSGGSSGWASQDDELPVTARKPMAPQREHSEVSSSTCGSRCVNRWK